MFFAVDKCILCCKNWQWRRSHATVLHVQAENLYQLDARTHQQKKLQALLQHECVDGTVAEPYRRLLSVHVTGGAGASKIGGVGLYEKAD